MRQFVLRIENYVPLITDISSKHWGKLPNKTKAWMDMNDFVQDGVLFARFEVMPHFCPLKAKFSTYLFVALHRFYRAYRESLTCEKRWATKAAIEEIYARSRFKEELYVEGLIALDAIQKLYDDASDNLQVYLEQWFLSADGPKRTVKGGAKFRRARLEFLERARTLGISPKTCETVLASARIGLYEPKLLLPAFPTKGEHAR